MAYSSSKHHVGINTEGYVISQRGGKRYYQKKRAPAFVNKFGGGDSSYRDASFWQYFVQTNWRNGAKQLKFDDAGKFWKSADIDTTILEQITLSRELTSAGQTATGVNVNCLEAWRATGGGSPFGAGTDSSRTVSANATETSIDSAATGTSGSSSISATNASFASGQEILLWQTYGTGAGNYEFLTISGYTAGTITTTTPLVNTYTTGAQVYVVKQHTDFTIDASKTLTGKAWTGTVGGVFCVKCTGTFTLNGTLDLAGLAGSTSSTPAAGGAGIGFRGGQGIFVDSSAAQGYQGQSSTGLGTASTSANGTGGGGGYGGSFSYSGSGGGGGHATAGTLGSNNGGVGGAAGGTAGVASLATAIMGGAGGGSGISDSGKSPNGGGAGGGFVLIIAKTITFGASGLITSNGGAGASGFAAGGGGAGGSILLKCQTGTFGTNRMTVAGGSGGTGERGNGGAGGTGRIAVNYNTSYTGTTTPSLTATLDSTLVDVPASTTSTAYAGCSNGKIYSWDGSSTWTEAYDARKLTQFETTPDDFVLVGDDGGTEKAGAQAFQISAALKVKGVSVYLKKNAGTPVDITVAIETNSTTVPSGTLANAAATGTITAFTSTDYAWYTVEFSTAFSLSATTTYWITLKTAAASNDNNYKWAGVTAGGYSAGNNATSTNGGSTWSAGTKDLNFKVLGNQTSVNCSLISKVGGTKKMLFGIGNTDSTDAGDAKIISYDGSTWAINKIFSSANEVAVTSLAEFNTDTKIYVGVAGQGKVYSSSDMSTYTLSKDIDVPQNPGYIYAIKEYNSYLYAGGGSPELIPGQYYNGFLYYNDSTTWRSLYPFDFTVIESMEFYDAYLFIGTYHGQMYVYDTSSLNPLFNFKDQYDFSESVQCMKYYDDKLYIGLYPQSGSGDTNAGLWVFERHGLYNAHTVSGVTGYRCMTVINGDLLIGTGSNGYIYKLSKTAYKTQGWYQSSYFDANLPSIDKLYKEVTLKHDPLVSGQSIVVYYRFKESDSWTTLGTSDTVASTEKTLSFNAGVYSKKITLKVELNTTDTTGTPKLTETIMKYTLYPQRKWMWTMRILAKTNIQLLDRSIESRTAEEVREDLEDLMATQSLYSFTDVDDTEYTVLVNDLDQSSWVVQDGANEDEVVITLIEA